MKDYSATIELATSPMNVFTHLKDVSKWWSKDFEGNSAQLNDEFVICHPGRHFSKQKLVEVIPDKKLVWLVTDSKLDWLDKDKGEWTDTKMIFELVPKGDKTVLHFTHEGLVPEKQCYAMCERGWNNVIKDWLVKYIIEGKAI
jgi:hypothetical protein